MSSRRTSQLAASAYNASSGTYVFDGLNERVNWTAGAAGVNTTASNPTLLAGPDLVPLVAAAVAAATANTSALNPLIEPKFVINSASLKYIVTNHSNLDCDITVYPLYPRYSHINPDAFLDGTGTQDSILEGNSSTGNVAARTRTGWTPFMSKSITECFKIGKPKRVHLQGGQTYTFKLATTRPLFLNYAKLVNTQGSGLPISTSYNSQVGWTRCLMLQARGVPVSDSVAATTIAFGPGAIDIQSIATYKWTASITPLHFYDSVEGNDTVLVSEFVQPQTGQIGTFLQTG